MPKLKVRGIGAILATGVVAVAVVAAVVPFASAGPNRCRAGLPAAVAVFRTAELTTEFQNIEQLQGGEAYTCAEGRIFVRMDATGEYTARINWDGDQEPSRPGVTADVQPIGDMLLGNVNRVYRPSTGAWFVAMVTYMFLDGPGGLEMEKTDPTRLGFLLEIAG